MKRDVKKLERKTRYLMKEAGRILRKWRKKLTAAQLEPLALAMLGYRQALEDDDPVALNQAAKHLEHLLDGEFAFARKSGLRDWAESLGIALMIALFLRAFVLEAFKIPSGSMIPTLQVGDHIFVNKFTYGIRLPVVGKRIVQWAQPERGDVIVFAYPHDPDKDYIKRVIGIPGDRIIVDGQDVYVNGERIIQSDASPYTYVDENSGDHRQCLRHQAVLGNAQFTTIYDPSRRHPVAEYRVKAKHLFVMGDNRDNSADSRTWGQVPFDNIKGRALVVWWSYSGRSGVRRDRIGHLID